MKKEIEEINEKRAQLWDEYYRLGQLKKKLELEDNDYTGKYIKIEDWGYMYVTWQVYEEKSQVYGDERMFFQGFWYNIQLGEYRDDFFFECDAMKDLWLPYNSFIEYVKNGEIKEMSTQEFIDKYYELKKEFDDNFGAMLGVSESDVEIKTKDEV